VERVALVTGASTGIGLAVAERLQADGYALGFHSHRDDENARARFEEAAARGPASWVVGDVTKPDAAERLVGETGADLGRLDVLVNNAGITVAKPALELTGDDFDAIFSVDVKGAFQLSVAAAKEMRRQGEGGAIVNVTSVHEHVPRPGFALYAAAKAALGMLTRSLALELAPDIRVNAVAPGAIATERNVEADELDPDIPLGRPGTPAEVAALVSFLAGDEAVYISGASVLVDGAMAQQVVGRPAG
jgi:NAD(P)-dependent dehydrogenase (short-subunit alcohol dehydrogenase family)